MKPYRLTRLVHAEGYATKEFSLDPKRARMRGWKPTDAEGVYKRTHATLRGGEFHVEAFPNMDGLAELIGRLEPNEALLHGVPKDGSEVASFTTKKRRRPGMLTRTHADLMRVEGPAVLPGDLDHDAAVALGIADMPALVCLLDELVPGLKDSPLLGMGSASAGVVRTDTGETTGSRGARIYVGLASGRQIEPLLDLIEQRALVAGRHYPVVTENGNVLIRGPLDMAMKRVAQPDFAAGALCGEGLEQQREFNLQERPSLVVTAPDAALANRARVAKHRARQKVLASDAVRDRRAAFRQRMREESPGIDTETVERLMGALDGTIPLPASTVIRLRDFEPCTLEELCAYGLAEPGALEKAACKDPLEPGYATSQWPATVLPHQPFNGSVGLPVIRSHAHGLQRIYVLEPQAARRLLRKHLKVSA